MSDLIIQILAASMLLATPLLLAAIGELVVENPASSTSVSKA